MIKMEEKPYTGLLLIFLLQCNYHLLSKWQLVEYEEGIIMEQQLNYEPMDIEISVPKKGIILKEKSVIALQRENGEAVAVGNKAVHSAFDEEKIQMCSPLNEGMIEDFDITEKLIVCLIKKAAGDVSGVRVGLVLSKRLPETQIDSYKKILKNAGAREVILLPSDIAMDELERQEERCKVIVMIKKENLHDEQ